MGKQADNIKLEELFDHFSDLFTDTSHRLKKCRDIKSYKFTDDLGIERQIKTISELKSFLDSEIHELKLAIDEIEE